MGESGIISRMFRNQYYAKTDVGLQRSNNEDTVFASAKTGLWIVADGMGGHAAGEVASAIVTDTVHRHVLQGCDLVSAIQKSHDEILSASRAGVGGHGMGSTVVALLSRGLRYEVCWVGDSRAYLYNPAPATQTGDENTWGQADAALRQLTTDHSYVQMLYQSGAISAAEMQNHPEKNIITQCLGSVELEQVEVDRVCGDWPPNSLILLCSDGLSDVVRAAELTQILSADISLKDKADWLVQAALDGGGKDNITVLLIQSPGSGLRFIETAKARLF